MNNFNFGEIFKRGAARSQRPTRSAAQFRPSYNENVLASSSGEDNGQAHPSSFPCYNFLSAAGILEDFTQMIQAVGLTSYMQDEREQYATLTKTFAESFSFDNKAYNPTVSFKIYDKSITIYLDEFCSILGIPVFGTSKKIKENCKDLLELYRGVTNDDDRTAQRGKIRNIQLPAIRYFVCYLATSILGRGNTSNISNYHLVFLATALNNNHEYNLGALVARRLAAKGPIFAGTIATRVATALSLPIHPQDEKLTQHRLDLAAMKAHNFVTSSSTLDHLVYRMCFTNGVEREIPLPRPDLFSICRKPWSRSREEMDDLLRVLSFHTQHDPAPQQDEGPSYTYTSYYGEAPSSDYQDQDEGTSSSHVIDTTGWPRWD
jgi:hypothetical protein